MADDLRPRALYAAFDRFPAPKGAGVHIGHAALTLFEQVGSGLLVVLADDDQPGYQCEQRGSTTIEIVRCDTGAGSLPDRVERFAATVAALVARHADTLELCQVRDPWGAVPVLSLSPRRYRTVFEVNGLPSIELAETHEGLGRATLAGIAEIEDRCLGAADALLVPSQVIGDHLVGRGADAGRVRVIPNGARVPPSAPPRPPAAPRRPYVAYVGALQPWQGVDVALAAFARLVDLDVDLVVCSAWPARHTKHLERLTRRLEIEDRVHWHHRVRHRDVAGWLAHAELSVAPLRPTARNLQQGCCPLKVLESMAVGTPVVASDLPAVRELVADGVHGRLVRPDRPAELARAVRLLLDDPAERTRMGAAGRAHVEASLTWEHNAARARSLYETLGGSSAR